MRACSPSPFDAEHRPVPGVWLAANHLPEHIACGIVAFGEADKWK